MPEPVLLRFISRVSVWELRDTYTKPDREHCRAAAIWGESRGALMHQSPYVAVVVEGAKGVAAIEVCDDLHSFGQHSSRIFI